MSVSYEHQMMSTRKAAFNNRVDEVVPGARMKEIKILLTLVVLASSTLTAMGLDENTWALGSSDDWLSVGPVYHVGPYYFPNSDLPLGTQRFLNTYPSYVPLGYSSYYQTLGRLGYNPYLYDPQAELELAAANHAFQKYLNNYYSKYGYYGIYP
jgi:hypothetical protein